MNNHLIYKYTSPSGKSYIGQTKDFKRRKTEHERPNGCIAFSGAIRKYGIENFIITILEDNLTLAEANILEEHYIKEHNTLIPNGYNLRSGGSNSSHSLESIQKMSLAKKGKPGIPRSNQARQKMSVTRTGKKRGPMSNEQKLKLSVVLTGIKKPGSGPRNKTWHILNTLTNETIIVPHLKQYCEEQQLNYNVMKDRFRLTGKYKHFVFIEIQ